MAAYMSLTVPKLKKELSLRGAAVHGRKEQLIERLEAYDRNFNFQGPAVELPKPEDILWPLTGYQQLQSTHKVIFPKLTFEQIESYFIYRLAGDKRASNDIKALSKGKQLKESDRVLACSVHLKEGFIFLSGIVGAAMKKNVTYTYKLKLEKQSGDPINSECECPAGKGPHGTCKHVAAVLFTILQFITEGVLKIKKTCTENLQSFNKPKSSFSGSPLKIEKVQGKRKPEILDDPRPLKYRNMPGFNDHARNTIINYLSTCSEDIAFRYIMPKANIKQAVMDHDYLERPYTEYWVDEALKVDRKRITEIEKKTRGQAGNKRWFSERCWRLTASRFGDICKLTSRRNMSKLCQSLTGTKQLETPAVLHGKNYESKALKAFENKLKCKTERCGFYVSISHPYLGASPDAIVRSDDSMSLVEVKCPFSGRKVEIKPGKLFPFLKYVDGKCTLNKGHRYYDQVQGQMHITNIRKCFFVVYTFEDLFIEEIMYDEQYCVNALVPKLECFYIKYLRPYIASNLM